MNPPKTDRGKTKGRLGPDRRGGKFRLPISFLFALALFFPTPKENASGVEMKRQKAPTFALKLFNGSELKSSEKQGKLVVLKFLASW